MGLFELGYLLRQRTSLHPHDIENKANLALWGPRERAEIFAFELVSQAWVRFEARYREPRDCLDPSSRVAPGGKRRASDELPTSR